MRYILDDLEIETASQRVVRGDAELDVKGLSFRLLAYLLEHGTAVVSFDELMEAVWAPAVVNEETVTQRVRLLRSALGDDGRSPRYIRSVRGQGYQLCSTPHEKKPERRERRERRVPARTIAIAAVLLAAVASLLHWQAGKKPAAQAANPLLERAEYYANIGQAENNSRAIALYQQVLHEEPDNVGAELGLSFALSADVCRFNASPDSAQRAADYARDVLERDASNARAYAALGYALDCLGLIDGAIENYERAVALDPQGRRDSASAAAHLYAIKGRLADALRLNLLAMPADGDGALFTGLQTARCLELLGFETAAEQRYVELFRLYPDSVFANTAYPRNLFVQGRTSDAEAALQVALERPGRPELFLLAGELRLLRGDREGAVHWFSQAASMREHQSLATTLVHLFTGPPPSEWFAVRAQALQSSIEAGDRWPENWLELALLEWHRGDTKAAFAALDLAVENGYRDVAYLRASPLFSSMESAPAFVSLIDRMTRQVADERERVLAAGWLPAEIDSAAR